MGYESKVFIVNRTEYQNDALGKRIVYGEKIAEFDLCKMGGEQYAPEFYNAFRDEVDFSLWLPACDEHGNEIVAEVNEDCYGEHIKGADIDELIDALKAVEQREHYRRIPPLIGMLEGFKKDEWDELIAVHYGY